MDISFTNREISVFIWVGIFLFYLFKKGEFGKSIKDIFKLFFSRHIQSVFTPLVLYILIILYFFYCINLWDIHLLKETLFWFFLVVIEMFLNASKLSEPGYLRKMFKHLIGYTVFVEFLVNIYSFNLIV